MASIPIDPGEKNAILNILKDKECSAAKDVYNNLVYYEDLVKLFVKYGKEFDGDNAYLNSLAAIPDDTEMVAVGIHNAKTGAINNPKVVIGSTAGTIITIDAGGYYPDLEVVGASVVDEIIVTNNTVIDSLVVAGASNVTLITIEAGSCINNLLIKSENGQNSTVGKVDGSCLKNLAISPNSTFNGLVCDPAGV